MRHPTRVGHDSGTSQGGFIPTHYKILGLPRDASSVDIAHAFREKLAEAQARPGAEERIESLRMAYQVLASPASRAQYDAELPPDPRQRREQERREREPFDPARILRQSGLAKAALAFVILVAALAIYRGSPRPAPPPAPPVAAQASPASHAIDPGAEERAVAAVRAQRKAQAAVARPMTPEEIFAAASRSVVKIVVFDGPGAGSQGSGVVVGRDAVVTNCHVLRNSPQVRVRAGDKEYEGNIRVADYELDLCRLSVTGLSAPPATMATFEAKVGQRVYAIGAPEGLDLTLSEGLISALRPTAHGTVIQTSAAVSPGSNGGGLFNSSGELAGIVTFQAKGGQNVNFALPVTWILEMTDRGWSAGLAPAR